MKRYETITIIDPDVSEDTRGQFLDRITNIITQKEGYLAKLDLWGMKKLAYEVRKKSRGYYVLFDFLGNGEIVDEMERIFRIDDRCIKFMTILLAEKNVTIEGVKEEIAQKEAAQRAKAAEREAQEKLAQERKDDDDDDASDSVDFSDADDMEE